MEIKAGMKIPDAQTEENNKSNLLLWLSEDFTGIKTIKSWKNLIAHKSVLENMLSFLNAMACMEQNLVVNDLWTKIKFQRIHI